MLIKAKVISLLLLIVRRLDRSDKKHATIFFRSSESDYSTKSLGEL